MSRQGIKSIITMTVEEKIELLVHQVKAEGYFDAQSVNMCVMYTITSLQPEIKPIVVENEKVRLILTEPEFSDFILSTWTHKEEIVSRVGNESGVKLARKIADELLKLAQEEKRKSKVIELLTLLQTKL